MMVHADRLSRFMAEAHLVAGAGSGVNDAIDVCVVQATDWITGGTGTNDAPACVDPVIRKFAIFLNDVQCFAALRDELKPYAERIANTNEGTPLAWKRAFLCADWALRDIAPATMDALVTVQPDAARRYTAWAATYRTIGPVVDAASARAAHAIARSVRDAACVTVGPLARIADVAAAACAHAEFGDGISDESPAVVAGRAGAAVGAAVYTHAAHIEPRVGTPDAFTLRMWSKSLGLLDHLIDAKLDDRVAEIDRRFEDLVRTAAAMSLEPQLV